MEACKNQNYGMDLYQESTVLLFETLWTLNIFIVQTMSLLRVLENGYLNIILLYVSFVSFELDPLEDYIHLCYYFGKVQFHCWNNWTRWNDIKPDWSLRRHLVFLSSLSLKSLCTMYLYIYFIYAALNIDLLFYRTIYMIENVMYFGTCIFLNHVKFDISM